LYDQIKVMIENSMSQTESEKVVSVSSRGQATIPKEFREELGIDTPGRVKFIRTEDGDIVVRPIHSVTDLRGVLEGETDKQGHSATERLREERAADKASDEELRQRYAGDDEADA
jgi:antitoxin PrlF